MKRKLTALFLCAVLCLSTGIPAFAEDAADAGTLTILNYNVDGLPLPAFLSSTGRDPLACSKQIPAKFNELNADIIAVQEDFNFHTILKNRIDAKYTTYHSGGIPFGDGLNYYSKLPLYNVVRVPWETAYGIFDAGSDELTPKGFLCSSMQIADGVFIDIYNMHADAYGGPENAAARAAEYEQMLAYIETYSKDHAVIVTGDTNTRFRDVESELYSHFIEQGGFKEAWIELVNDGNYIDIPYACGDEPWSQESWWGIWDSVEKVLYRDGGGVSLEATTHDFILLTDENGSPLSDHSAELVTLNYTIDRGAVQDTRTYEKERYRPVRTFINHVYYFFKALRLVLGELPKLISGEIQITFK